MTTTRRKRAAIAGVVASVVLQFGCNNEPGSMTLVLKSEKEVYQPAEPIRLIAELRTKKGPVCLTKGYHFKILLDSPDQSNKEVYQTREVKCGMGGLLLLPILPLLQIGRVLDVADAGGRYEVSETGSKQSFRFDVIREGRDSS